MKEPKVGMYLIYRYGPGMYALWKVEKVYGDGMVRLMQVAGRNSTDPAPYDPNTDTLFDTVEAARTYVRLIGGTLRE